MSSNHFIPGRRFYDPDAVRPKVVPPSKVCRSVIGGTEVMWLRDVAKGRKIAGIASTSSMIDSDNVVLLSRGMQVELPVPLLSKHVGLFGKHKNSIGEVFHAEKSSDQIYIRARLFDTEAADYAWELIDQGETPCLSVGYEPLRVQGIVEGKQFIDRWRLLEVSTCRQGMNPDARLEILSLV